MAFPETQKEVKLVIRRTFQAPRERVFAAWTEPEQLKQWQGPEGCTTPSVESDFRVGGKYRIAMQPAEGEVFHYSGVFREIVPPERLVYTFQWEKGDWEYPETLVTVEFRDLGSQTEIVLTHDRFPEEKMRDDHGKGWNSALDCLARFLAA